MFHKKSKKQVTNLNHFVPSNKSCFLLIPDPQHLVRFRISFVSPWASEVGRRPIDTHIRVRFANLLPSGIWHH